ncbi:hypothetical protein HAN_2g262 (nucleomorph) [Hemiselmis andersenii]|uniref:Uncharacterized protein n=1 Tax=Hemiselmis andersenii TaxID=464988 RepID=A9BKT1_HEMAN|nr:hypothetical protein HAN_2g262 [Hemiselmis andersenii]ABW98086.1 hypothetical protein HAN_2g262 [Hemiselmis andersenii]|mmetsp:Transcript_27322/g.66555  ORF Transcript_27322/g.66555 Transcript_27322/m.66555 type:complete len:81 (-) Transcript_27322:46-288(-)
MEKIYYNSPFRFFFLSKKNLVFILVKKQINFIGTFMNFDTQSNFSFNYVIKLNLGKTTKNNKLYKKIIINGSKICFFSIL